MTNFIPIFPLSIVLYPGEQLNLHIFEPRYKQLINECLENKKPFGIPVVLKSGVSEMGTIAQVEKVEKVYDDGKMDITTTGLQVFRILEVVKEIPEKLYSGAIVTYPDNVAEPKKPLIQRIVDSIRQLHKLLNVSKDFSKPDAELSSYDIAHHAALSLEEEYELLQLLREDQRLEYLSRHLKKILPVLNEMESLKNKIKMNGHFQNLSSNFNL